MRTRLTLTQPLPGEHLLAVDPRPAPLVAAGWHRRLNLWRGRALSDVALRAEQAGRAGRLATDGQALSPGVVAGLEIALERERGQDGQVASFYRLSPGLGLAASGEDVVMPAEARIGVRNLRVMAPSSLLAEIVPAGAALSPGYAPNVRDVGEPLSSFVGSAVDLPRAAILLLQPVKVERIGTQDELDPCPRDEDNDPYDDWQLADGCRLLHLAWPTDVLPLPGWTDPGAGAADRPRAISLWRNRLAYAIFEAEARCGPEDLLPWEAIGVGVGLAGFDKDWKPLFVDRFSVVRAGGKPKRRSQHKDTQPWRGPLPGAANPFLWEARLQQFAEQVGDLVLANVPADELDRYFEHLPPAGLLPKGVQEFLDTARVLALPFLGIHLPPAGMLRMPLRRVGRGHFFPASFAVEAVPVPSEQLDVPMEAAAALAPFHLSTPDQVRLLVPVPQAVYDPNLLQVERVDPIFDQTIQGLVDGRNKLLRRRSDVRERAGALSHAITGEELAWPASEPGQTSDEVADAAEPDPPEAAYGTAQVDGRLVVQAVEALKRRLADSTPLKKQTVVPLDALPPAVKGKQAWLKSGIIFDESAKSLVVRGVLSPAVRDTLVSLGDHPGFNSALNTLHLWSQKDDLSRLDELGLERFIQFLQAKIDTADDQVNLGFLRAHTDIYRLRQFMLGTADASRLATSPALATIAQGESAAATQQAVGSYADLLRKAQAAVAGAGGAGGGGGPAGGAGGAGGPAGGAGGGGGPAGGAAGAAAGAGAAPASPAAGHFSTASLVASLRQPISELLGSSVGAAGVAAEAGGGAGAALRTGALAELIGGVAGLAGVAGAAEIAGGAAPAAKAEDVVGQSAVIGAAQVRSLNLAERMVQPRAPEAQSFAVSNKSDVVRSLQGLDMSMEGIQVPGLIAEGEADFLGRLPRKIGPIESVDPGSILAEPPLQSDDEAAYFVGGVQLIENTIATLRAAEGRIQGYREAIAACQQALNEVRGLLGQAMARLGVLNQDLTVSRHDVALARALLADEQRRVAEVNHHRDQIIDQHVTFLAYYRPRSVQLVRDTPAHTLAPALLEPAVPPCLSRPAAVPEELRRMVSLFRGAPADWLVHGPRLLGMVDRLPLLSQVVESAMVRVSQAQPSAVSQAVQQATSLSAGMITSEVVGQALQVAYQVQSTAVAQAQSEAASLDAGMLVGRSWLELHGVAKGFVSLGDLIDGSLRRSDINTAASRQLDQMAQVAACLYRSVGQVAPALRLQWALALSEYDQARSLRQLAVLSDWGQVGYAERRGMQELVDWLYAQVNAAQPRAVALMDDLVRVCILLASHAPVAAIIAGHVIHPVVVWPGILFDVAPFDPAQLRVGMQVQILKGDLPVVEAVVEDLAGGQASARVTQIKALTEAGMPASSLAVDAGMPVHLSEMRL